MCTPYEANMKNRVFRNEGILNMENWRLWCRLCAKENPEGNIGVEVDNNAAIASSIEKFFSVQIKCDDKLPKMLCSECTSLITTLIDFAERVDKVQQMLLTLEENTESSNKVNVSSIRLKYDLLDEYSDHVFIQEPGPEILYIDMNNKDKEEKESDKLTIVNPLKRRSIKLTAGDAYEEKYDDNGDGVNSLDESLIDVPSLPTKKPRQSNRNNIMETSKTAKSLTHSKKEQKQQQYTCSQCSRVCKWKRDYEVHLLTHLPDAEKNKIPCSHCDKKFITNFRVTQHIRLVHMDERPFACDKCEKTFKENRYLKKHMETHNPNKHVCAKCGLQLNSIQTLNNHLMTHSDERKHKCDYCGRAFKFSKGLKDHLLLHTNLRPYTCNFCNRSYNNSSACRTHKKSAHAQELADWEAAGGGKVYTRVPTLESLKTIAKTLSNSENDYAKINRRIKYRVKKFPTSETSISTGCDYDVNPNRVRYSFPKS